MAMRPVVIVCFCALCRSGMSDPEELLVPASHPLCAPPPPAAQQATAQVADASAASSKRFPSATFPEDLGLLDGWRRRRPFLYPPTSVCLDPVQFLVGGETAQSPSSRCQRPGRSPAKVRGSPPTDADRRVLCLAGVEAKVVSLPPADKARSEERRVGKECLRLCRSRWSPYH